MGVGVAAAAYLLMWALRLRSVWAYIGLMLVGSVGAVSYTHLCPSFLRETGAAVRLVENGGMCYHETTDRRDDPRCV